MRMSSTQKINFKNEIGFLEKELPLRPFRGSDWFSATLLMHEIYFLLLEYLANTTSTMQMDNAVSHFICT